MKALISHTASVPRCPPRTARFGAGQLDLKGTGWRKDQPKPFPTPSNLFEPQAVRTPPLSASVKTVKGQNGQEKRRANLMEHHRYQVLYPRELTGQF